LLLLYRQVWCQDRGGLNYIVISRLMEVHTRSEVRDVKAIAYFMLCGVAPVPDTFLESICYVERRRVSNVISGGQFRRIGTPTVPRPALV